MPAAVSTIAAAGQRNDASARRAGSLATVRGSVQRHRRRSPVFAFAPVAVLGLAGIGAVFAIISAPAATDRPPPAMLAVFGSLLAALVSVYAAFVTYRLKQEDDARIAAEQRVADQRGVAVALRAEIDDNLANALGLFSAVPFVEIWRNMKKDPAYLPFIVADDGGGDVYSALMDKLVHFANYRHPVLPALVAYYAADKALNESIAVLGSKSFLAMCNPADPASVAAGRPRQMRWVIWMLLSVSDIYGTEIPDHQSIAQDGEHDLAALVKEHAAARYASAQKAGQPFRPLATMALEALDAFKEDSLRALRFLQNEIARG